MAKVLVVDDEASILLFVCTLLNNDGHESIPFSDGEKLMAYVKDTNNKLPDLIISDVMMPGMDGYTLHNMLLEDKRTKNIPFVVLTAKGSLRPSFQSSTNVAAFLKKPFDITVVQDTIRKVLAEKK